VFTHYGAIDFWCRSICTITLDADAENETMIIGVSLFDDMTNSIYRT
jgi:hypothetical protein